MITMALLALAHTTNPLPLIPPTLVVPLDTTNTHTTNTPKSDTVEGYVVAPARFTSQDVLNAGNSARHSGTVMCIFKKEVGGYGYDPYVPHGQAGVLGPGGLATFGLLPQFYSVGYTNPHDPFQVAAYIDTVLDQGRYSNWPYLSSSHMTC